MIDTVESLLQVRADRFLHGNKIRFKALRRWYFFISSSYNVFIRDVV